MTRPIAQARAKWRSAVASAVDARSDRHDDQVTVDNFVDKPSSRLWTNLWNVQWTTDLVNGLCAVDDAQVFARGRSRGCPTSESPRWRSTSSRSASNGAAPDGLLCTTRCASW